MKKKTESKPQTPIERYKKVYRQTRDHKAAVRAYCGNNVWAQENAKATGNW